MKVVVRLACTALAFSLVSCGGIGGSNSAAEDAATLSYLVVERYQPSDLNSVARLRTTLSAQTVRLRTIPDGDCTDELEVPSACEVDQCEIASDVVTADITCSLNETTQSCGESEYALSLANLTMNVAWDLTNESIKIQSDLDAVVDGVVKGDLACSFTTEGADDNLSGAAFDCDAFQCSFGDVKLGCTEFESAWKSAKDGCAQ